MNPTTFKIRLIIVLLYIYHFILCVFTILFFPIWVILWILFDFDIRDYNNKILRKI